jgi:uncharacterized sporulation protein YeaH/YhbH (DUF444 family)
LQIKGWLKQEIKAGQLEGVTAAVRQVQAGTRILQTACVEAKARKLSAVTRLVPKVKKSIEQFVQSVKVLIAEAGAASSITVGNLKHKNLHGEVVPELIESEPEPETEVESEAEQDAEGAQGKGSDGGEVAADAQGADEDDEATQ